MIYTIRKGDTLSKYAALCKVDQNEIWDHPYNQIIKAYWPKGIDTKPKEMPAHYSIYLPGNRPISDYVKKGEKNGYVVRKGPLEGDLHLKINVFKKIEYFGWNPSKQFEPINIKRVEETNYFGQKSGINWENTFPEDTSTMGVLDESLEKTYLDIKKKEYRKTKDSGKDFNEADAKLNDTLEVPRIDGYGVVYGNPKEAEPLKDGFVYIFSGPSEDKLDLFATYHVSKGNYQSLKVTASDDSHEQKTDEPSRKYILIKDFYPLRKDLSKSENYKAWYVYTSEIPLKWKTLCEGKTAIAKRVGSFGTRIIQFPILLTELEKDNSAGDLKGLQDEYLKSEGKCRFPDIVAHQHKLKRIDGKTGVVLTVANIQDEALRRNKEYQKALQKYLIWKNDEYRSDQTYVYGIVKALLKNKKIGYDKISKEKLDEFEELETSNYYRNVAPFYWSSLELINLLNDPRFLQVLVNYSHHIEDESADSIFKTVLNTYESKWEKVEHRDIQNYQDMLCDILLRCLDNLDMSRNGMKYLDAIYMNAESYYNRLLKNETFQEYKLFKKDSNKKTPAWIAPLGKSNAFVKELTGNFLVSVIKNADKKKVKDIVEAIDELLHGSTKANKREEIKTLGEVIEEIKDKEQIKVKAQHQANRPRKLKGLSRRQRLQAALAKSNAESIVKKTSKEIKHLKTEELSIIDNYTDEGIKGVKDISKKAARIGALTEVVNCAVVTKATYEKFQAGELTLDDYMNIVGSYIGLTLGLSDIIGEHPLLLKLGRFTGGKFIPVLGIISCLMDAYTTGKNMEQALKDGNITIAIGHGLSEIGTFVFLGSAVGKFLVSVEILSTAGTIATISGVGVLIGIALIATGVIIATYADTAVENWAEDCIFGKKDSSNAITHHSKENEKLLDEQIEEILELMEKTADESSHKN